MPSILPNSPDVKVLRIDKTYCTNQFSSVKNLTLAKFVVSRVTSGQTYCYMRATAVVCALALMLMTACSMRHRLVPSAGQDNAPLGPSPAGDFVFGDASRPAVALRINPDGTYSAEHASPIEFWPMIEGNKVYPQ